MANLHPSVRAVSIAVRSATDSALADEVIIYGGSGAPSGGTLPNGQVMAAGQRALYLREDGTASTLLYMTANGGTNWTAADPAALSTLDLNGTELILDADADTSITADTDDQIDIKISGADDFRLTANKLAALSGSHISLADSSAVKFGDSDDIAVTWDGTDLAITQAGTNSAIKVGVDGAGMDLVLYGDTASASLTWDQSADKLILGGVAKIQHQTIAAATGTAIPVTHSGSFPITQNGAETNTLADPTFIGQWISIFVDTDTSGARVITAASRINQAGNTIITLTEVGDFIKLEAITIGGALKWQVVANDGAALS
jgi:hypothetical protein